MGRRLQAVCSLCLLSLGVEASVLEKRGRMGAATLARRQAATPTLGTIAAPEATGEAPLPANLDVPDYVKTYAPYVYLFSQENYFPAQLQPYISQMTPRHNTSSGAYDTYNSFSQQLTLENANTSTINTVFTYFTSNTPVQVSETQIPNLLASYGRPDSNGVSQSPVIVVLVNKTGVPDQHPPGDLDAFTFFFYGYNLGPNALGERFGNHVGDWEHSMVRFLNGVPQAVFVAEHDFGEAFTYDAMQKMPNGQPVMYSANGTHATYATPGNHDYSGVPFINDYTDAGIPWNTSANALYYWYSPANSTSSDDGTFEPATGTTLIPNWLYTVAKWGDQAYEPSNPAQSIVLGYQRFSDGPTGPVDKTLVRTSMGYMANLTTSSTLPQIINGSTALVNSRSAGVQLRPAPLCASVALAAVGLGAVFA